MLTSAYFTLCLQSLVQFTVFGLSTSPEKKAKIPETTQRSTCFMTLTNNTERKPKKNKKREKENITYSEKVQMWGQKRVTSQVMNQTPQTWQSLFSNNLMTSKSVFSQRYFSPGTLCQIPWHFTCNSFGASALSQLYFCLIQRLIYWRGLSVRRVGRTQVPGRCRGRRGGKESHSCSRERENALMSVFDFLFLSFFSPRDGEWRFPPLKACKEP